MGQIFSGSSLAGSTGEAITFCERFVSGSRPSYAHFCACGPAACRSVRAGSTLLHVGRFRRRDLWDMSDGYLGVWRDRRGAVVSATLDAYQASQQGVRRPSASSCSSVPRSSFFDGDPDVPRRGASDRGTGEPGKHWIGRDADDDPFISTPGEETDDAASRRRVRFR